eukprot:scaffold113779_cov56-Phaeocystis_antarctica.AAC.1
MEAVLTYIWRRGLRGLYHVLASSLFVIICFVKNDLPDRENICGKYSRDVSTKGLAKRSSFFHPELRREQDPQLSNNSRSAPRSGNAATLPTLQMESRHAASSRLSGFRHRKYAHGPQRSRPFM